MANPLHDKPGERETSVSAPPVLPKETTPVVTEAGKLIGLLSDPCLRLRKGPIVWLWTAATPFAALACIVRGLDRSWEALAYGVLTGATMAYLVNVLDQTQAVLKTPLEKSHVGALVEALEWPNRRVQGIARRHLTYLLPTLAEEDALLLNEVQRGFLWSRLNGDEAIKHPDFVIAILKAAGKVGDEEAVSNVTRLARLTALYAALKSVRREARVCLPTLEQRLWKVRLCKQETERRSALAITATSGVDVMATSGADIEEIQTPEQQQATACVDLKLKALEIAARNAQQPGMRQGFLFASWGVIVPYTAFQTVAGMTQGNWLQATAFAGASVGATLLYRFTLTAKHRELANQLAELDDIQAVGRLAEALWWPDTHIRYIAAQALTRLLPRLRASDATVLNSSQRNALYRMLTLSSARTSATLITTILKALEQVGDSAAIPYVDALAKNKPLTISQKRIVEAAAACLPYLQDQARHTMESQQLLRAASSAPIPPQELLRAAFATPEQDAAHLLRAGTAEDIETK